jgi:hypothetical protein
MENNNKILFIIPDGVGIKNYLYSNILVECVAKAKIHFYTPLNKEAFSGISILNELAITPFTFDKESNITKIFKEAATFGRLLVNAKETNNPTILTNWNYKPTGLKRKILNFIAQKLGVWASKKYSRVLKLENIALNNWNRTCIEKHKVELKNIKPTSIFITHQRVSSLMPICIAAKELNIPVISVIYSWDNLPKGRLAIQADKYLVWSEYMKDEIQLYYPEIPQNSIVVTGTPQFEFYLQENLIIPKEEFAKKFNLDINKKWICFSGDDIKTSPFDHLYLRDLAEAILQMKLDNRPQIIFRRCPVDFTDRYDVIINQYNEIIITIDPLWSVPIDTKSWGAYFPKLEDISMQVTLSKHCEFVVNLGSTMAFDFSVFHKPCFYINYDIDSNLTDWSVKTIYNYQHFKSMDGLQAVGWINGKEQIGELIEKGLKSPEEVGKDKQLWFQKIVQHPLDQASVRIAAQLIQN